MEQKAVKSTAFDLQLNPASPGMQIPQARPGKGQAGVGCAARTRNKGYS